MELEPRICTDCDNCTLDQKLKCLLEIAQENNLLLTKLLSDISTLKNKLSNTDYVKYLDRLKITSE